MTTHGTTVLPRAGADSTFRQLVAELEGDGPPELVLADGTHVQLPDEVMEVLREVVAAMAHGKAVTVAPIHTTLTTQQAAELLGVSRTTFVKLLDEGEVSYTRPGRHRRVLLSDVLAYRDRVRVEADRALDDLVEVSQELGLYDDDGMYDAPQR